MEQEYENLFTDEELGEQLMQECIANLRWENQNREEQKHKKALASREAEKEIQLPAYLKKTDEGFLQYVESSCLPTPDGENIGLRKIGTNQSDSKGQITERKYSVDEMIILAREIDSGPYTDGLGSEWLYQKVWAHVRSCLPIECKEDYVKSMVRSAIIMYETSRSSFVKGMFVKGNLKNENSAQSRIHNYKKVIFSGGKGKIYVDKPDQPWFPCSTMTGTEARDKDNYDRAMKFIV